MPSELNEEVPNEEKHEKQGVADETLREDAMENTCEDLGVHEIGNAAEECVPDDPVYKTRSGRTVKRKNYKYINRDNMQMSQLKRTNEANKNLKKVVSRIFSGG